MSEAVTTEAHTEVADAGHHEEATAFGLNAGGYVALAMIVVLGIMLWARVPALIAKALDAKIAGIREQLDTAAQLRQEAEALKADYEKKARDADKDIAALKDAAEKQAADIVAKAKDDATQLIARHTALAASKIEAAERSAIEALRARAATAAALAARDLIAESHDAAADRKLVDKAISGL
ncbi:MAG: synthase subunit [Proteobacteria bacterium]|nr:synthase subunit [Pseudomonadota bacterium]